MKLIPCVRMIMSRLKRINNRAQIGDTYFAIRTIWSTQSNETLDRIVIEGAASSSN